MATKRISPASLKKKIRILTGKQKELRLEILRMKENLLISDKQVLQSVIYFFKVIYQDFKSLVIKPVPPAPLSTRTLPLKQQIAMLESNLKSLKQEQKKLSTLSRSPLVLLVWVIKGAGNFISFVPRLIHNQQVKKELESRKPNKQKRDIIYFTSHPFQESRCRARFLAEGMGKRGERVFYIEGRFDTTNGKKIRFAINKEQYVYTVILSAGRDIEIKEQPAAGRDIQKIATSLRHFLREARITEYTAIIEHPFWAYLLPHLKGKIVYDCNRDFQDRERYPGHITKLHRELLKKSNLVVSSSRLLAKHLRKIAKQTIKHIPNGCDYEHFAKASVKKNTCSAGLCWIHKPVIGYIGDCDERIDAALVEKVALAYPKASIVMIGKIDNQALLNVGERIANVFLLGEKPYEKLPEYLQTFDICFIPFIDNKSMSCFDSMTYLEFLSAGKAIVLTNYSENRYGAFTFSSKDIEQFINNLKLALSQNSKTITKKRQAIAVGLDWSSHIRTLQTITKDLK